MIGRMLFLSVAAFIAYRYIASSNKKAHALNQKRAVQEILPPLTDDSAAVQTEAVSSARLLSAAAEPDPGR